MVSTRRDSRRASSVSGKIVCMIKDISNQRFGRLVAIAPTGEMRRGVSLWRCRCDCGETKIAAVNSLRGGLVRSCGCLIREVAAERQRTHGMHGTRTYKTWDCMIQRCSNPSSTSYPRYGGIGTTVCDRWRKFESFLADMGERPSGMSLDRIDSNKGYEPGNCRWSDTLTQARNRRKRTTTYQEAEQVRSLHADGWTPSQICKHLGLTRGSVNGIIYLGQISEADRAG